MNNALTCSACYGSGINVLGNLCTPTCVANQMRKSKDAPRYAGWLTVPPTPIVVAELDLNYSDERVK